MPLRLYRRPGSANWYARGTVRGVAVHETTGTPDRRLAREWTAAREAELFRAALPGARRRVTFAEAAASYLEHVAPGPAERRYVARWMAVLAPGWDGPRPDGRGWATLDELADQALVERKLALVLAGPGRAPATRARTLAPLVAVLNHAAARGMCERPRLAAPPPGRKGRRTRWLTPDEAVRLLAACSPHLRPLVLFLLCTGARLAEAVELGWADVDLGAAAVAFRGTKNGDDRIARLPPAAVAALAALPGRDGRVFRRPDGLPYADKGRLSGGQVKTAFRGAGRRAGLGAEVTPHVLRHTWATWFYGLTRDLLLLKDEGGWRTTAMCERYTKLMLPGAAAGVRLVWGESHPRVGRLPGGEGKRRRTA